MTWSSRTEKWKLDEHEELVRELLKACEEDSQEICLKIVKTSLKNGGIQGFEGDFNRL